MGRSGSDTVLTINPTPGMATHDWEGSQKYRTSPEQWRACVLVCQAQWPALDQAGTLPGTSKDDTPKGQPEQAPEPH